VFNDVGWKELEGHSRVLVSIERHFKIHVFYICPIEFGSRSTDDTVPYFFCRDHAGCTYHEFIQMIDKVVANRDWNLIWVIFLGAVVYDNSCICESYIFCDVSDFVVVEVENPASANSDTFFALGEVM
jgi:hypothetical protein